MLSRHFRMFAVVAVFVALAQANWFENNILHIRDNGDVQKKDGVLSDVNSAASGLLGGLLGSGTSSTSSTPTESSSSPKSTSVSSTASTTTSTPSPNSSSSTASNTASNTKDDSSSSSNTPTPTPTPSNSQSSSPGQSVVTDVTVISGSTISMVSTETSSSTRPTGSGSLAQNESTSSSMSSKTKSTVIGVVVGVGGAIVLAGLGVVAWRIWGRRKNEDESDGLMGFRSGSAGQEKPGSVSGPGPANPFQSTLENYHNPAKNVNPSANF